MSTMNSSVGAALLALLAFCGSAHAQAPQPTSTSTASAPASRMERLSGVWVEGPGFNITYGGDYDSCAQKCLGTPQCVMIEYYRPEKKCNMYDKLRPRVTGGSSDVALRK